MASVIILSFIKLLYKPNVAFPPGCDQSVTQNARITRPLGSRLDIGHVSEVVIAILVAFFPDELKAAEGERRATEHAREPEELAVLREARASHQRSSLAMASSRLAACRRA